MLQTQSTDKDRLRSYMMLPVPIRFERRYNALDLVRFSTIYCMFIIVLILFRTYNGAEKHKAPYPARVRPSHRCLGVLPNGTDKIRPVHSPVDIPS